jgi:hypothetical protein
MVSGMLPISAGVGRSSATGRRGVGANAIPASRHVFLRFEERRFGYSANRRRIAGDAKGGNMSTRDIEKRVVQYGVRTAHSSTILVLTDSRAEAERALDMFGEGVLIERTVSYTRWRTAEADLSATG